jgi:hypothetical protein
MVAPFEHPMVRTKLCQAPPSIDPLIRGAAVVNLHQNRQYLRFRPVISLRKVFHLKQIFNMLFPHRPEAAEAMLRNVPGGIAYTYSVFPMRGIGLQIAAQSFP